MMRHPPDRYVFLDETGANTKMARLYGWGPKSERVVSSVPHGHWQTTTFVGALRTTGLTAPLVIDGAMNGELFLAYVQQQLIPTLTPGDIVVLDTSAAITAPASAKPSRPPVALWPTCLRTAPISTPSNSSSRSGNPDSANTPNAPSTPSGPASANSSPNSSPTNAATISATPDTLQNNRESALSRAEHQQVTREW